VSGKQRPRVQRVERMRDHALCSLVRKASAPVRGKQVHAQLEDIDVIVGTKPSATEVRAALAGEDRPVLHAMFALRRDLAAESGLYLFA